MSPDQPASPAADGAPVISPPTLIDLQILIQQQFRKSVQLTGAAALMFLVAYVVTSLIGRSGSPSPAVEELRASNHAVSTLAVQLAGQAAPVPAKTAQAFRSQLLSTLDQHARLAENASADIGQQQAQEIPSAARDLLQLILVAGGAVMLGLLGLHRLQGIDAEIRGVRDSLSTQLTERARELQGVTEQQNSDARSRVVAVETTVNSVRSDLPALVRQHASDFQANVNSQLASVRDTMNSQVTALVLQRFSEMSDRMQSLRDEVTIADQAIELKVAEAEHVISERTTRLDQLIKDYPWLGQAESVRRADEINEVQSVEQAHALATRLVEEDSLLARRALEQIVKRELPGASEDFHNAYVQAMRQDELALALAIIDRGFSLHPFDADVFADRLQALAKNGRASDAKSAFEKWALDSKGAHLRGWRPLAFYLDAAARLDLSGEERARIEATVRKALKEQPYEPKIWGGLVTWLRKQARLDDAIKAAEEGLRFNPYAQQLNYALGEIQLQTGHAAQAIDALERALEVDFQEQYQHDVNQVSVWLTLAQAYEAVGRSEDALKLYDGIPALRGDQLLEVGIRFARSRRAAILARRGEVPEAGGAAAAGASAGQAFTELIDVTVRAAKGDAAARKQVEEMFLPLLKAQENLRDLAERIVRILGGDRDGEILVKGLDAHDTSVVKAILKRLG